MIRLKDYFVRLSKPRALQYLAVATLLLTTAVWSYGSAMIASDNADQLVNPYLFTDWQTFHTAVFPAAHSQLLKWPLFWLTAQTGITPDRLVGWTVGLTLLTVTGLIYLLHKIERRPRVFAVICLLITVILLLIPPQPYDGSLLPTNFAMLTTRNIEYLIYALGLIMMLKAHRLFSWRGAAAITLFGLLFASDQLFLQISVGSAALLLFIYALARKWQFAGLAARWLLTTVVAALFGYGIITIINATGLTQILSEGSGVPYQLNRSVTGLALAILYGGFGILANLGASPAFSEAVQIKQLPMQYVRGFLSIGGPAYIIATGVAGYLGWILYKLVRPSFKRGSTARLSLANRLSLLLTASGCTAFVLFIVSDHYYAVDARYLAIWLIATLCGLAAYSRRIKWRPRLLAYAAIVLGVGVISGLLVSQRIAQTQAAAYDTVNSRNDLIAQALSHHRVTTLVGDYWRVLPTKLASRGALTVTPLDSCTEQRRVLTTKTWQPDLRTNSFAYLLSASRGLSGYPACSYETVTAVYGQPNSRIRISGSIEKPDEQLLIYDHGINGASQLTQTPLATSPLPVDIRKLAVPRCDQATIMNVTAHEDDDLLFINPDTLRSLQAGKCIRSVYLTAGDAGQNRFYWLGRQLGTEAAYAEMLQTPNVWVEQSVKLADAQYATFASLRNHPEVTLIFFNLPDGGLRGTGFAASRFESLERLRNGSIPSVTSVDTESSYTGQSLVTALAAIMKTYQVSQVRTQAAVPSNEFPDHSDHIATGQFARDAAARYSQQSFDNSLAIPVQFYIGYPIHGYPENVSGDELIAKEKAFMAYAKFDGSVCHSHDECARTPTYGSYLTRQYRE